MTADPITFPAVTSSQLQLSQLLCTRQNTLSFSLAEQSCSLTLKPSEPVPSPEYCLILEINGQAVRLYLGRGLLNQLLTDSLNDRAVKKLPKDLFKAAMVHCLSPIILLMNSALGATVEFISLKPADPDIVTSGLTLQLTLSETSHTVLVMPNPVIMEMLTHLPTHTRKTMPDIPVWAELILGRSILSRMEISSLASGDIVFLQQHVTGQQLIVCTSRRTAFIGDIEGTQVTIRQRMELMEADEQAQQNSDSVDMADLPVELLFEIGRQKFSAAEIQAMQTGYVFDLERPVEQPVQLRANGKVIAECQLVQIDNRLGARITHLKK